MSVDKRELEAWSKALKGLADDSEAFMMKAAGQEAQYAVRQARKLATEKGKVNTGMYRRSFQGSTGRKQGKSYIADFFNPLDYALHLEYGFRSHFVPGEWQGRSFVYGQGKGGMYVGPPGGFVPGTFIFRLATERTRKTQAQRISNKISAWIRSKGL